MQKLLLSIPEPCHEDWHNMTPTEQGRFCNACAKEVIDFSMMTDTEVLDYFSRIKNEKVCGRTIYSQLNRPITRPKEPKKKLFWYWNYIMMFFMFFSKSNAVKAQGGIKPVTELSPVKTPENYEGEIVVTSRVVTGKVTDADGNAVSFATIKIKGTNTGVSADANGGYSIRVNLNDILVISGAGFTETEVSSGKESVFYTVLSKSSVGEVVVSASFCFGGVKRNVRSEANNSKSKKVNSKISFEVKEDDTGLPIENAKVIIIRKGDNSEDKILSGNKGVNSFIEFKINVSCFVKVEAEGYEPNEFAIDAKEIKARDKQWEVFLKKKNVKTLDSVIVIAPVAHGCRGNAVNVTSVLGGMIMGAQVKVNKTDSINILVPETAGDIKVYPNPVQRGSSFNIELQLKRTGNYELQLSDANGRILLQKKISVETKQQTERLQSDSRWGSGIYFINVFDEKNKLVSTKRFVFI